MTEKRHRPYVTPAGDLSEGAEARPYTVIQMHFLARLEQLNQLLQEYEGSSKPDPARVQMIKKAIYSTLRDCDDQELKEEARAVLAGQGSGS